LNESHAANYPKLGIGFKRIPNGSKDVATRKAGEIVMQAIAAKVPELAGGSADLNLPHLPG